MRRTTTWMAAVFFVAIGMGIAIGGCSKSAPSGDSPAGTASQVQVSPSTTPEAVKSSAPPPPTLAEVTAAAEACRTGDAKACDVACTAGNNEACLTLGKSRLGSDDDAVRRSAVGPLRKACNAGIGRACGELGPQVYDAAMEGNALAWRKNPELERPSKTEMVELERKGCDLGDGSSCAMLASFYGSGLSIGGDLGKGGISLLEKDTAKAAELSKRAVTLLQKECDGGNAESCTGLGYLHLGGKHGVTKDKAKALKLFKKACEAKEERGCAGLKNFG